MKITGHVLSVSDCGDEIEIVAQGGTVGAADWRPWSKITFRIPADDRAKKTYHLGRSVTLEITPS